MSEDEYSHNEWYERKSALMEEALGKEFEYVMHALIPYSIGGSLDLYYYPNGIPGTGIATKELSEEPGEGSTNSVYRNYELVMFTRHAVHLEEAPGTKTPFGRIHANISAILNCIAVYSAQAELNPRETCEFPAEMGQLGGKCLVFDGYTPWTEDEATEFGLLAVIEVFRSEMEWARSMGTDVLLRRLKESGHYPYSDLDREPVA